MKPENARPFDPHNRPLKGEWIILQEGSEGETFIAPIGDADVGYTQAVDAIKRPASQKKPFPVGIAIVLAIVLGAIVFFAVNRFGGSGGARPKTSLRSSTNTLGISPTGSAPLGPPELKLNAALQKDSGADRTFVYDVNLNLDGAKLSAEKPLEFAVVGDGKVVSQEVVGNQVFVTIHRTGAGKFQITSLNYAGGSRTNTASPRHDEISWQGAKGNNR